MFDFYPSFSAGKFFFFQNQFFGQDVYKRQALFDAGISYAIEQIIDLLASGVQGIHVYAMNNIEVSRRIYEAVANML